MTIEDELIINKFAQNLVTNEELLTKFNTLNLADKRKMLIDLIYLIIQSKAIDKDILPAIETSCIRPTYTPCVMLKKSVNNSNLMNIANLIENELSNVFILFLSLFKIAYQRRYNEEKNNPNKWWYWDLSQENNVKLIIENFYNDKT